jgi:hypothetical protein
MRNLIESIITHIPSAAAQLLPIGGFLALLGTILIALMVLWRRWTTRATRKSTVSRLPQQPIAIVRPGGGQRFPPLPPQARGSGMVRGSVTANVVRSSPDRTSIAPS